MQVLVVSTRYKYFSVFCSNYYWIQEIIKIKGTKPLEELKGTKPFQTKVNELALQYLVSTK